MGELLDGKWQTDDLRKIDKDGKFVRRESPFRNWVTPDGTPGPSGKGGFKAEAGRYHLYICHACPWAHRSLIMRRLKGLEDAISVDVVSHVYHDMGWEFSGGKNTTADTVNNSKYLYEVYLKADREFTGRVSVPVLWDKQLNTIVSNESSEIIRMFNSGFGSLANGDDYYPEPLRTGIDEINEKIFHNVNNGVYKSGFAKTQEAYEEAVTTLFATLNELEHHLGKQRYLVGPRITEADWRLFTTLVRFDAVYVGHFKCNIRRIVDYPNLQNYLRELYQVPGISELVFIEETKQHYYMSHETINPLAIIPMGPELSLDASHDRARFD
jgi:glutathionyl-hydroquinone reductase